MNTSSPPLLSPIAYGHVLALAATLIWSSLYIFARTLAERYSPIELSFWRWVVAFVALLPFTWRQVWAHRALVRDHVRLLMLMSLIGMVGFSIFVFVAGRTTSATNLSLLAATAPVFIACVCRFVLHERLSAQQIAGLCIAVCGVVVLVTRGNLAHVWSLSLTGGDLWMLLGAMCFGTYSVMVRFKPATMPLPVFLTVIMGMGMLWLLPPVLWQWCYVTPIFMPTWGEALSLAHIGVGTSVLAFLLWNKAILLIGAVRAGVVYYSLPFFSYVLAMLFLGERLTLPQAAGGALIIGGIVFSSLNALRQVRQAPPKA